MSRQSFVQGLNYKDSITGALKPSDQAEVFVYEAGTTKTITLYADRTSGSTIANPFITGETGTAAFWANTGDYDIKVHDTKGPARFGDYTFGWQSSPIKTVIAAGELSEKGDISWSQDPETGAWIPQIKAGSVGASEIADGTIGAAELAASVKPVTWYTPKIINTEETRENSAFGTLTTKDEITGVVVPENGILRVSFAALVKSSAIGAGVVGVFIGSNQASRSPSVTSQGVEETLSGAVFGRMVTNSAVASGLEFFSPISSLVTTGRVINALEFGELAAGTYAISIRYKASSGSITAKERKLCVEVHGI